MDESAQPIARASDRRQHPYLKSRYVAATCGDQGCLEIPEWGGAIVRRTIAAGSFDGAGAYPMTPLAADANLAGGLARCRQEGLVSVVLVPDPLTASPERLTAAFDVCRPFKTHYLIDPSRGPFDPIKHHRDRIRRGHRRCRIEEVALAKHLEAWSALYGGLVAKHQITGAADLSLAYFEALASEPSMRTFAAFVGTDLAGMTLWFEHEGVAYNHLTASNALGYANGANYALYDVAIAQCSRSVVNLGGCAGSGDVDDGLTFFKQGFANATTQAHICGSVLDEARYAALTQGSEPTHFFPAYRAPAPR